MTTVLTAIFLVSAAVLGLELALIRALSIGHWHHFSYLVISTALLGFGASGTIITIFSKTFKTHYKKSQWVFGLGMALTIPLVFSMSQKVPLDELQLIWDRRQILYLFAYYLLFFAPFFCGGSFIAVTFAVFSDKAHRLYFYNMVGSGLGAAGTVALMYGNNPSLLLLIISCTAFAAAIIAASGLSRRTVSTTLIFAVVWIFLFCPAGPLKLEIKVCENKSLVYYTALPEAQTVAVRYSPLGRLDCVQAPAIRYFPGLSMAYKGRLPEQMLIISDADSISAINNFRQDGDLSCYDYFDSAIAYHLAGKPDVCIIGAGGGFDVVQAIASNAGRITAIEMNPQTIDLVRNQFDEFAGGLYRRPDVEIIIAEGRNFLQTTQQQFDILKISLLDSFSTAAAGLYALNESHLYTIEGIAQAFSRLRPRGLLSITRILKPPPKDSFKMLATVADVLRRRGITEPAKHIMMVRSWATATIIASPEPFSDLQIENARRFARERCFDLVHLPGIEPNEANIYNVLEKPIYYESAQQILSDKFKIFYHNYIYNIQPATDDRPYFFDFFKWKSLPYMIRTMPRQWLLLSEWGYLVLAATLLQAICASSLLILLPLWVAKPVRSVKAGKLPCLIYFLLLGLAYMFLEMGFIQKMTLLIGHPVFGVAVILFGFLVFSGFGSLISDRLAEFPTRKVWVAVSAIVIIGIAEITIMAFLFDWLVSFSRPMRMLLGLAITAPLALFMGVPFPTALKQLNARSESLIPWAWGVNGFASVVGAVLGTFLAISVGFTALILIALACYLFAGLISKRIFG